jgi:hypothetical protein
MAYKSISMKNIIIIVILFTNILVANAQDPNCYYPLPWEFFPHRSTTSKGLLWEYEWISAGEHVDCSEYDGWVLADYDNFEGIKLDPTKWTIAPWYFTTQNWPNEVACYLKGDNNVKVNGGFVDLIIKKEDHSERIKPELDYGVIIKDEDGWPLANDHTFNYTSGFIGTRQRMPAGKVETYLKIPENDRTWPAFWSRLDNWPGCSQEIDGFEFYMKDISFYKTLELLNQELSPVKVWGFRQYHSDFTPDENNFKIEPDLSGGSNMVELVTGPLDYYDAKYYLIKIVKFIQNYGYTNEKSSIHFNLSFNGDKNLNDLNTLKLILNTDEDEIYRVYPSRKDNVYAKSVKKIK